MRHADRIALLHGPYQSPRVKRGDWLEDGMHGLVPVGGYSDGLIAWPRRRKTGKASLILCDDLVRAVQVESEIAVAHWWGVSIGTVYAWRKTLGVGRITEGTDRLYRDYKPVKIPDDMAAVGRVHAAQPEAKARMAATKRGKPATAGTRAALLAAAKRPKSDAWKRQLSDRNRARWAALREGRKT